MFNVTVEKKAEKLTIQHITSAIKHLHSVTFIQLAIKEKRHPSSLKKDNKEHQFGCLQPKLR